LIFFLVKLDRATEVIDSTVDFWTRNFDLFKMVKTLLQGGKSGVENHGRGPSTNPTQMDERVVAAKYLS
jgi:hypothetical protein